MAIDVKMIRESFEVAKPIVTQVVDRFYQNLFADYPDAKPLFNGVDMPKQKAALTSSLVTAVDNLDNPNVLTKFLSGLGERHVKYGVQEAHYEWVGATLLKTFSQFFGDSWTPELNGQWAAVYGVMADTMKAAARQAPNHLRVIAKERGAAKAVVAAAAAAAASTSAPVTATSINHELSAEIKQAIRRSVKDAVQAMIKAEVQKCFDEELKALSSLSAEDLLRKMA